MGTPVQTDSILIIKKVAPPKKARFPTTYDSNNDMHLLIIGYFSLNGEFDAAVTTSLRYVKNQGIVIIALAGRQGPPKNKSSVDLVSISFAHMPGDKGDTPVAALTLVHAAANTIPDMRLATKL
mmetsp:Transcript_7304/g.12883  ORF Transcript_7304/g.12883 Transcript_7304/m.12883 type:complete len:124 (-) Transcript_7304:718-1089(-)